MMVKWFGAAKQSKEKQVSHLEMHFRVGKLLQQSMLHLQIGLHQNTSLKILEIDSPSVFVNHKNVAYV